jgi:hypothetical protein
MARPHRNGRNRPRTPVNVVYRTIQGAGGPTAVCTALGISEPTLKRWRRLGTVSDARGVLLLAALVHPGAPEQQLRLARRLAGLRAAPGRRALGSDGGARPRREPVLDD